MSNRKLLFRLTGLLLAIALILSTSEAFTTKISAAKTKKDSKTTTEYFAYRVDVMDARVGNSDCVTLQVMSSIDGVAYVYIKHKGDAKPSTKDIMDSGYKTLIPANEETDAHGHIYWLDKIEVGKKYDIYIVFEDVAHNTYGPYTVKGWTAKYFPAGNGTKKKPYQIWTKRHLYNMREFDGESNKGKYFKLMQDIDLNESIYSGRIMEYASTFYGTFDGNGKTIRHLKGIFFDNLAATATVKNLYMADVDASYWVNGYAGILSETNKGIIEKCAVVNSSIYNSLDTGIITGNNFEDGIIRNCAVVDCTLTVSDNAGGIAGRNEGTIKNCYAKVHSVSDYITGAIVGRHDKGTVSECLGDITFETRSSSGNPNIGGIVGYFQGSAAYIKNCISLYKPEDPEKFTDTGSIWADYSSHEYVENATENVGALVYDINDIVLTEKEINGSTDEAYLAKKLAEKRERWLSHHGASADTIKEVANPAQKILNAVNADGKNKVSISGLNFKYTHGFENETAAYNKKFKMTQKKLEVKAYKASGKVNLKKIKADTKNDTITITWDKVKGAEGYIVYRSVYSNAANEKGGKYSEYEEYKKIESPNTTEYVNTYTYPGKIYYYRVRAYTVVNGVKVLGPYSDIKEIIYERDK